MPIIYGAVAKGTLLLAEHAVYSGNFGSVAKDYLGKYQRGNGRYTYIVDTHVFSFLVHNTYSTYCRQELSNAQRKDILLRHA